MQQELYHEIFGSILDRSEMTPYLLRNCGGYHEALSRANRMLSNRGFDLDGDDIGEGELERARGYVSSAIAFTLRWLLPSLNRQLVDLVITSYSIHYTKLYENEKRPLKGPFAGSFNLPRICSRTGR